MGSENVHENDGALCRFPLRQQLSMFLQAVTGKVEDIRSFSDSSSSLLIPSPPPFPPPLPPPPPPYSTSSFSSTSSTTTSSSSLSLIPPCLSPNVPV